MVIGCAAIATLLVTITQPNLRGDRVGLCHLETKPAGGIFLEVINVICAGAVVATRIFFMRYRLANLIGKVIVHFSKTGHFPAEG